MSIAFESDEQQLRERLRKMSDVELVRFGKAARSLCRHRDCPKTFTVKLNTLIENGHKIARSGRWERGLKS